MKRRDFLKGFGLIGFPVGATVAHELSPDKEYVIFYDPNCVTLEDLTQIQARGVCVQVNPYQDGDVGKAIAIIEK